MERLKQRFIRTPLELPLQWVRLTAKLPWRLRHPELKEIYLEPIRFERVLAKILTPHSNTIDVGAHLGGVLSSVTKLAPHGRHFAFEPTPRKAEWLRAKFPEVEVSDIAVSDFCGPATFFEVPNRSAVSGLRRDGGGASTTVELSVSCRPLDACVPSDYLPHLLKVDVIGAELQVLRGAIKIIERAHPILLFASGARELAMFDTTPGDVYDWISDRGYRVFFLKNFLRDAMPADRDDYLAAHVYPFQAFNFVAQYSG